MKEKSVFIVIASFFFLCLYFTLKSHDGALELNSQLENLSVMKLGIDSPRDLSRIDFAPLKLGTRYVAVLKSGIESSKLQAFKLPYLTTAMPHIEGVLKYRIKSALEDFSSEMTFKSGYLSKISKNIKVKQNGVFELVLPILVFSPVSSEDFLELSIALTSGSLNSAYIELYKADSLGELILFYPLVLAYASFVFFLFGSGFLFLVFFGLPKEGTFYSLLLCLFFGILGFDALIRGNSFKFLIKFLTLGGFGIIYAFDLGKEFYRFLLRRS